MFAIVVYLQDDAPAAATAGSRISVCVAITLCPTSRAHAFRLPHRQRAIAFPNNVCFQYVARFLRSLERQSESQLLCFHARAHSFVKTPGVGVPLPLSSFVPHTCVRQKLKKRRESSGASVATQEKHDGDGQADERNDHAYGVRV